ncbi:acyltransferase family protein [Methylocapsa acidiphila]|uniref:acyltransferase family protein n=1 Tax=Methylocapsa acidiphila TaxID=133552 RepID=UPI0012EBEF28|nr:acyltransferase family protein [Methylocapsa acidiphila]
MTKFRHDINALRALAVSAVVLYHFKAGFIFGGYVGVDIFFVISGYLMTNIIVGRLDKGSFNLFDFYYDRAKRIVPGLLGLCSFLIVIGYFFIDPMTYNYLAYTSMSAIFFFSNIRFAEAVGYFDPQSEVKWLLHTWSLSVEWQFYMIYPILLLALTKIGIARRYLGSILLALAAVSLYLSIIYSTREPAVAFYLLPQRAWELLAGGIVALHFKGRPGKYSARALLVAGFTLIAASMYFFNSNTPWPYYWALFPVVGTCCIIAANRFDASPFKNQFVQLIGKWSYSIYLWHWPIAVTALYLDFNEITALKIIVEIVILAALLACGGLLLSFWKNYLEPLVTTNSKLLRWAPIAGMLALSVGLAVTVISHKGFVDRRADSAKQLEIYRMVVADWDFPLTCDGMDPEGNLKPCRIGQRDSQDSLVIGDSFAMQAFNRFAKVDEANLGKSITFLASSGCPPVPGIKMIIDRFRCNGFAEKALQFAEAGKFKRIAFISNWYGYFGPENSSLCFVEAESCALKSDPTWYFAHIDAVLAALGKRLMEFRDRGVEIVFVSATPSGNWDLPPELLKRQFLRFDTTDISYIDREAYEEFTLPLKVRLKSLAASVGAKFIEPLDFLCSDGRCPTIDEHSVPYFRDQSHFRTTAVRSARFQFLDDALGLASVYGATPTPSADNH